MKFFLPFFCAAGMFLAATGMEYRVSCEEFPEAENVKKSVWDAAENEKFLLMTAIGAETSAVFILPQSGDYYIWLRTLSFGGNFRKAALYVNGTLAGTLGDNVTPDGRPGNFVWARTAEKIHLDAGKITIKLVSTSAFTRADAMIFSDDAHFKPEGKMENISVLITPDAAK